MRSWAVFDWNDLRYLLAISEAGTLVGAARALGVKHTTVSRRLAALEHDLGARLLRKGAERYALTPAGEEVLALAAELKARADAVERRVAGSDSRVAGVVRVTMPETVAGWLVQQLPALRARHPDLVVNVLGDTRVYDLLSGEADLAIRLAKGDNEGGLLERKLVPAAWSVYASRAYVARRGAPRTLADYAEHDLIGFEGAADRSPGGQWFRENVPDARFAMRGNGVVQIFNAAIMGFGVTLLPCFMADPEPSLARLTPEVFHNRRVRLLVPADLARLARVRAVMDFIVELFQRDAALFEGKRYARELAAT